jgi:hypothetical protein
MLRFNLLTLEFGIQILAHSVHKMPIIQEPKKVALWNKWHFEEKKTERVQQLKKFSTCIFFLKKNIYIMGFLVGSGVPVLYIGRTVTKGYRSFAWKLPAWYVWWYFPICVPGDRSFFSSVPILLPPIYWAPSVLMLTTSFKHRASFSLLYFTTPLKSSSPVVWSCMGHAPARFSKTWKSS